MRFCTWPTVFAKNHAPIANMPSPIVANDSRFVAT